MDSFMLESAKYNLLKASSWDIYICIYILCPQEQLYPGVNQPVSLPDQVLFACFWYLDLWIWPSINTINRVHHFCIFNLACLQEEILSGDPIFGGKNRQLCRMCYNCLWLFCRRVVWPTVTQTMSKSYPSTISGTFSLTNLQEKIWIGITTLSGQYPIICNSSHFIHDSRPVLPDRLSLKSLFFVTTYLLPFETNSCQHWWILYDLLQNVNQGWQEAHPQGLLSQQ